MNSERLRIYEAFYGGQPLYDTIQERRNAMRARHAKGGDFVNNPSAQTYDSGAFLTGAAIGALVAFCICLATVAHLHLHF